MVTPTAEIAEEKKTVKGGKREANLRQLEALHPTP